MENTSPTLIGKFLREVGINRESIDLESLPSLLDEKFLRKLEKNNEIIYFNYLGDTDFSKMPEDKIREISEGDSHAIVGDYLYVKLLGSIREYKLIIKGFLNSNNVIAQK